MEMALLGSRRQGVYHFEGIGWRVLSKIPSHVQRLLQLRFLRQEQFVPSISPTRDGVWITGVIILPSGVTSPLESTSCTILNALDQRKELDKWSLQSASLVDNGRFMAAAIIQGAARAVMALSKMRWEGLPQYCFIPSLKILNYYSR
jgi:hypothetical protein